MKIGDLVCIHSSYNHTDEKGVKYSNVYLDISTYDQLKVTPSRPKFFVPFKTPGVLLEIIDSNRADFKWTKILFPQGVGYVSLALLRNVTVNNDNEPALPGVNST